VRSPLTVCVERLQKTAGPAANSENIAALSARLLKNHGTFQACSRIILMDFGLTVRLLRIANSARFKQGGNTVTSVSHAAAMLGTDSLTQLIDTVPRHKLSRPVRELVALSHLTAVMARNLISRLEPRYAEEAYICGLLRNIGELSYALEMPDDYKKVLAGSQGHLAGLRDSFQRHSHFEFDELSTGLLFHWSLQGSLVLAALSTPDALLVQSGHPETDIALAASLAHHICMAYFRGEPAERDNTMRSCSVALATQYQMREAQVENFCRSSLESLDELMLRIGVSADGLRLTQWLQSGLTNATVPAAADTPFTTETTIFELLQFAIDKGVDRAAWLPIVDQTISLGAAAGSGWPGEGARELASLIQPRKPPFLLAFGQRQDVWIDFAKDDRFCESPLALKLKPTAFFLLPVCEAKRTRGCLYFDLAMKRDFAPESLLPTLSALRDHMATKMLAT
jgi:HD-like signal output (HDOD) protein